MGYMPLAFPCPEDESNLRNDGMTLRDYFAAQSLSAALPETWGDEASIARRVAERVYKIADAMLAERLKQGGAA